MSIKYLNPSPRMSQATIHGDLVFTAGQVDGSASDVATQTKQILGKIDSLLAEAGCDKSRVLIANIWLSDVSTFAEMNAVWETWITPETAPARATVGSILAGPEYKVEIAVIAAIESN
ncbi:MAG: RidA family protein [Candidatus Eremiobacteraeota bacterium]|nr:RidA family protein [Candidatus Eremiobacteraeota bacterium]